MLDWTSHDFDICQLPRSVGDRRHEHGLCMDLTGSILKLIKDLSNVGKNNY